MMKPFELLYIVPAQYTEQEVEGVKAQVATLLEKAGANVLRHEVLAKIRLAYPIKDVRHGTYVLVYFDADGSTVADLERSLRLTDEVLRHQLLNRTPGIEKEKVEISAYVAPLTEEGRREGAPVRLRPVAPLPAAAVSVIPIKAADASLSVEELDKRLDQLLDEDVSKTV